MSLQPAPWRKKVSDLTGIPLDQIIIITQGWTTVQRDKVLRLLDACYANSNTDKKLDHVLLVIDQYRENGSPSVKKLVADVDEALL